MRFPPMSDSFTARRKPARSALWVLPESRPENSPIKDFYAKTVSGHDVEEVARIRKIVFAGGLTGDLKGTEGPYWYKVTTAKIDLMKKVEDKIAEQLEALATGESANAQSALLMTSGAVAV